LGRAKGAVEPLMKWNDGNDEGQKKKERKAEQGSSINIPVEGSPSKQQIINEVGNCQRSSYI